MTDKQKLFHSIINYLSADKENAESFQVAIDILKGSTQYDKNSKHDKNDLLEIYSKNSKVEEKKEIEKKGFFSTPLITEEEKYNELLSVITSKGFFKGCETGSDEYKKREEKAKEKFQSRQKKLQEEADECKELGNKLFGQKKYNEAIETYLKGIEKFPTHVLCYANLASCLISLKRYEDAVECLDRALKIDPKYAKAYARLAVALSNLGLHNEAITAIEEAIKLDPKDDVFKKHQEQIEKRAGLDMKNLQNLPNLSSMMQGGMPDMSQLNALFSNPEIMKMASTVMQQPGFQDMVGNFMKNMDTGVKDTKFNKESIKELEQYEEYQKSKKIQDAVKDISENGMGSMTKYMADTEIQNFFLKVAQDKMKKASEKKE